MGDKPVSVEEDEFPRVADLTQDLAYYFVDRTTVKQAVPLTTVYKEVYGEIYASCFHKDWVRMYVLKRAIISCRRSMRPFIVPVEIKGRTQYFVPTKRKDMEHYVEILKKAQAGIGDTLAVKIPRWLKEHKAILELIRMERDEKKV